MASFRHILVATDFSPCADRGVETAVALATQFAARLTVLHVVEHVAQSFPFPPATGAREAAQSCLDETVSRLRRRMLSASGLLREGNAPDEICAAVAATGVDLVVLGSEGRRGLPRFVLGSVAERVVGAASAPVLTVHPSDHVAILAGGMDRFRHVLAATDLGEASQRAVDLAVRLACDLDAALTLVHVYEPPSYAYDALSAAIAEVETQAEEQARRALDDQLARAREQIPAARAVMKQGAAWHQIVETTSQQAADLVVLGTRGRRGLAGALLGGVAAKIVRVSPVPVITVAAAQAGAWLEAGIPRRASVPGGGP